MVIVNCWPRARFQTAPGEIIREVICPTLLPIWRKRRGGPTEDLVEDHPGGLRTSWWTPGLRPTTIPRVTIDLPRTAVHGSRSWGMPWTHWRPASSDRDDRRLSDSDTVKYSGFCSEYLMWFIGPAVVGVQRWNKQLTVLVIDLAQSRLLFEMPTISQSMLVWNDSSSLNILLRHQWLFSFSVWISMQTQFDKRWWRGNQL